MSAAEFDGVVVEKRAICPSGYYYSDGICYRNSWSWWGRWVFAGVVILCLIALIFLLGCINARRRRRRGLQPLYGTGWMGPKPEYGPGPGYNQPPPPQYSAQPMPNQYTGTTFNTNEGYYGHHNQQNEGVQIQQPQQAYYPRGGDDVYAPPPGPPPAKA